MSFNDPKADYLEEYKGYNINAYKQPYKGGSRAYYFGVYQADKKVFGVFFRMSDTQAAIKNYTIDEIFKRIFDFGLAKVKKIIDAESYQLGSDIRYWVNE